MGGADRALWSAGRTRRDEAAFAPLVRPPLASAPALRPPLALPPRRARGAGCSAADADDVLQDALVRLAREEGDRPVEVGLRAWIGRVVFLRSKMLRREESRRRRRERSAAPAA